MTLPDPPPIEESRFSSGSVRHNWANIGGIKHVKEALYGGADHREAARG